VKPREHKPVAQLTDLEALEGNTKNRNCSASAGAQPNPPRPAALNQDPNRAILAVLPPLRRYARILTRDVAAAEDLVQDCIARALEKIGLWEQGTDLRAWMFTILYRQHISRARRDARQRASMELQKSHARVPLSPNQTIRLEVRDLKRAIAKLPEEQQSVILLVGLKGMAYAEAAAVVNAPVGTVRSRVARGRETLRVMTELFPPRHSRRPCKAAPDPQRRPAPHSSSN
jgi:RNA polymerase sigma-70 factor, ECF subfamily